MASFLAKLILLPASKIYGAVTWLRNKFFDWNFLSSKSFDVPVICVGNLAVGGTGKTPHVEYIVDAFRHKMKVAVLSRGYRRKTKGFIIAGRTSTPKDIGDEAYQMYQKFGPEVMVAVCEDRVTGIEELLRVAPEIGMIVLDDAFQHRYVKPAYSIVVSEYAHPAYADSMLPYGRLRESARGIYRADAVIVSKCPEEVRPMDYRIVSKHYDLFPSQQLYFSRFRYQALKPVFPDVATTVPYLDWLTKGDSVLAVAGIGNPRPFVRHIKNFKARVKVDIYPDHHDYTRKDIDHLLERFRSLKGENRILVTTEKDAVRLAANPYFPYEMKAHTFCLPVKVSFDAFESDRPLIRDIERAIKEKAANITQS